MRNECKVFVFSYYNLIKNHDNFFSFKLCIFFVFKINAPYRFWVIVFFLKTRADLRKKEKNKSSRFLWGLIMLYVVVINSLNYEIKLGKYLKCSTSEFMCRWQEEREKDSVINAFFHISIRNIDGLHTYISDVFGSYRQTFFLCNGENKQGSTLQIKWKDVYIQYLRCIDV